MRIETRRLPLRRNVMEIPRTFRIVRIAKGYSQRQLADYCNVSQSYIAKVELAQCYPTLDVMRLLCQILTIDMNQLDKILLAQEQSYHSEQYHLCA